MVVGHLDCHSCRPRTAARPPAGRPLDYVGKVITALHRVENRHGETSLVVEDLRAAWPDLMAQVAEIEALSQAMTRPGAQPM